MTDQQNRPVELTWRQKYYIKNRELIIARALKWKEDNPERVARHHREYTRRKKEAAGKA